MHRSNYTIATMQTEFNSVFTIFNFDSRQNGLGYCSFIARVGVSVTTLVLLLEEVWSHLPSLIFFLVALAASLVTLFLPETKNIRLPETIEDVEQTRCQNRSWVKAQHVFFSLSLFLHFYFIKLQIYMFFVLQKTFHADF